MSSESKEALCTPSEKPSAETFTGAVTAALSSWVTSLAGSTHPRSPKNSPTKVLPSSSSESSSGPSSTFSSSSSSPEVPRNMAQVILSKQELLDVAKNAAEEAVRVYKASVDSSLDAKLGPLQTGLADIKQELSGMKTKQSALERRQNNFEGKLETHCRALRSCILATKEDKHRVLTKELFMSRDSVVVFPPPSSLKPKNALTKDTIQGLLQKHLEEEIVDSFVIIALGQKGYKLKCTLQDKVEANRRAALIVKLRPEFEDSFLASMRFDSPDDLRALRSTAHKLIAGLRKDAVDGAADLKNYKGLLWWKEIPLFPEYLLLMPKGAKNPFPSLLARALPIVLNISIEDLTEGQKSRGVLFGNALDALVNASGSRPNSDDEPYMDLGW